MYFDFAKAFDKINHRLLIKRLSLHGISGKLLCWIRDFLSNRKQIVRLNQTFSESLPVTSGVIQGTVLGPTLFNIFINSIDCSLEHCSILKYADDLRIYLSSSKSQANLLTLQRHVQNDIDNLSHWALDSKMTFNINKCFFTPYNNHCSRSYDVNNSNISYKTQIKDLGMTVTSPLNFNKHIDQAVARAYSTCRLGLIHKLFICKSEQLSSRLFKAFVRPILEYACIIWNPSTQKSKTKLERVQRRMCRMIPSIRHLPYKKQLTILRMFSLETRRLRYQLITMFKLLKNKTDLGFYSFFQVDSHKRTRGHNITISNKYAKNNYRRDFFSVSAISHWNRLPRCVVNAENLIQFKNGLTAYFLREDIW